MPSILWKWTKRVSAAVLSALILALALGAAYQAAASHSFDKEPPPGIRIEAGGRHLHLYCKGQGTPTIVVNPGVGVWSLQWRKIQDNLAAEVRVCTYDRAGYGWSDAGRSAPTATEAAEELHLLLQNAGVIGPYLMVGESYGGYVTRLFAEKHRGDLAGVVLIDSAHERQWDEIPEAAALAITGTKQLKVARWLSWFGIFRFFPMDRGEDLPPAVRSALIATQARPQTFATFDDEMSGAFASAKEVAATHSLGDLPLVVVSAGHSFDQFYAPAEWGKISAMNEKWMRLQEELARLSTRSVHLVSKNATHGIARTQPEFVTEAIRRALQLQTEGRGSAATP